MLSRSLTLFPEIPAPPRGVRVERSFRRRSQTIFRHKFKGTAPSGNAEAAPVWRELWRVLHLAVERNVIELAPTLESSSAASGITTTGASADASQAPFTFRRYLARENIIRHFERNNDPNRVNGMGTLSCEKGIVERNIIELESQSEPNWKLAQIYNGQMRFASNERASGKLVLPYLAGTTGTFGDDAIQTPVEDALIVGML